MALLDGTMTDKELRDAVIAGTIVPPSTRDELATFKPVKLTA